MGKIFGGLAVAALQLVALKNLNEMHFLLQLLGITILSI